MSAAKEALDPLLHSLFVKDKKTKQGDPSPLSVLNQLVKDNMIRSEAVQSAFNSIRSAVPAKEAPLTGEKTTNKAAPKHRYRHVALQFYYDGAGYSGLSQNVGQDSDQSIERALFEALMRTKLVESRETSGYSRCGRTDKGVSAAGQVVALRLKSNIPLESKLENGELVTESDLPKNESERIRVSVPPKTGNGSHVWKDMAEYPYAKMLNGVLPDDIRILGWSPVSDDFSARFSATTRTYRYFFVKRQLQLDKMREALALMVGKHDFRNLCKMDVEKVYNFERLIHEAEIVECPQDGICYFQIRGQAFLWHQIRCIASILFLVGKGLEEPSIVKELLNIEGNPGKPGYSLAAELPLVLHHCGYPNLHIGYSSQNLWSVSCLMEQQWEDLVLSAARVRNCIESLSDATVSRQEVLDFVRSKLQDRQKKRNKHAYTVSDIDFDNLDEGLADEPIVTWGRASNWMAQHWDLYPGGQQTAHIPLLQRSRGTTYEEKIDALSKSKKRQQKYEENVVKKRKSAEEDAAFYEHMTKQGGTGI
jgi:tRNA pseudouridine38/39 synthase